MLEVEFNLREEYFAKARSAIFAMSSLLTVTFSLVLKGNNFLGDKKKTSGIFKEWARLLNFEAALVKGVIESDKKRYKRYQNQKSSKAKPKAKGEVELKQPDESEVVLPEETFDIEESA